MPKGIPGRPPCTIEGCDAPNDSRGMCKHHAQSWRVYGDAHAAKRGCVRGTAAERLWARVDRDGPVPQYRPDLGPCWLWGGAPCPNGYGKLVGDAGPMIGVHRLAYELLVGPIPEGLQLDHLCRVRTCVNPAHLEPVTGAENTRRAKLTYVPVAACLRGHPYDDANTYLDKTGARRCRRCARERATRLRWAR